MCCVLCVVCCAVLWLQLQEEYIRPLDIRPNQDNGVALVHW
jgi:hypothetical protein